MSRFSFLPGQQIKLSSELYDLRRKLDSGKWQLEKVSNGEYLIMEEKELLDLYFQKLLVFATSHFDNEVGQDVVKAKIDKNFTDFPENLQKEATRRLKYVRSIKDSSCTEVVTNINKMAEGLGDHSPPHPATVRRWAATFTQSLENICSLIPNFSNRGNKKPRYPEKIIEIAEREIKRIYLNNNRNSVEETLSAVRNAINLENMRLPEHEKLPKPKVKFLRKIISEIDAYEVMRARQGKNAANKHFREANQSGEIIKEPLERVEIDHTILDLIVVDEKTYLPLGRPTLTIALDRCTRCICGYHISYDPPSYISIMKCLAHAIKPKEYVRNKFPIVENNWLCWGIPQLVVVDNGREFHSKDFEAAALSLLIEIRYCPAGQPWWKGAVERAFRTLGKTMIHMLPGTTFSNIADRGGYDSLKESAITESDLNMIMHMWVCDIYHQTPNRSTLRTPSSLWRERINSSVQCLPESTELLDVSLASIEHRTLFHYGISLNNLTYNSAQLQKVRKKYGELIVLVRWNRSDLGAVHILDEAANVYLKVPCTWSEYASGLSLWLHKAIRNEALSYEGPESQAKLDAAKARLREACEMSLSNKKQKTRKNAARAIQNIGPEVIPGMMELPTQKSIHKNGKNKASIFDDNEQAEEVPSYEVIDVKK